MGLAGCATPPSTFCSRSAQAARSHAVAAVEALWQMPPGCEPHGWKSNGSRTSRARGHRSRAKNPEPVADALLAKRAGTQIPEGPRRCADRSQSIALSRFRAGDISKNEADAAALDVAISAARQAELDAASELAKGALAESLRLPGRTSGSSTRRPNPSPFDRSVLGPLLARRPRARMDSRAARLNVEATGGASWMAEEPHVRAEPSARCQRRGPGSSGARYRIFRCRFSIRIRERSVAPKRKSSARSWQYLELRQRVAREVIEAHGRERAAELTLLQDFERAVLPATERALDSAVAPFAAVDESYQVVLDCAPEGRGDATVARRSGRCSQRAHAELERAMGGGLVVAALKRSMFTIAIGLCVLLGTGLHQSRARPPPRKNRRFRIQSPKPSSRSCA